MQEEEVPAREGACVQQGKNTKNKHLTYDERRYIEDALASRMNFREIATSLGKDPSTISKEIRKHRTKRTGGMRNGTDCAHSAECRKQHICYRPNCDYYCATCSRYRCDRRCGDYKQTACGKLEKPPYVCNGCERKQYCRFNKYYYRAKYADDSYAAVLSESRKGINLSPDELDELDKLVTPLIRKGQPLAHIYAYHADEIPCSRRTLYEYINLRILGARNIHLPRKVRYKPRKKRHTAPTTEPNYRKGRTYEQFQHYLESNPGIGVIEMDTVHGIKCGKVLLTMFFRNSNFMLCFLLPSSTQEAVLSVFEWLYDELGHEIFKSTFPVILTDNGSEFQCPNAIERDCDSRRRTILFYCNPNTSWQKGALEKNHEFIRYVVPKGKPFDNYTHEDITLLSNHINSLARDSLNGRAPFELATLLLNNKLMRKLQLKQIPYDEVFLKPELLKRNKT